MRYGLIVILLLSLGSLANAQVLPAYGSSRVGNTGFQFLKIAPDAASAGIAGSGIAIVNDVSSLYWNPAGICHADTQHWHMQLCHTQYFANVTGEFAGVVHPVSKTTFVGAFVDYFNTGEMPVTTEFQPFGTGQTFRSYDMAVGLSVASNLTDNFSFGITLKYIDEAYAGVHAGTAVADFGFQYDVGKANTRFGVSFSNFGLSAEPTGKVQTYTLRGYDTITSFDKINVPAMFRVGVAWDAVKNSENRLTLCAQLNHPTDNRESISVGGEYAWNNMLLARTGYSFGADMVDLPNLGFGIRFKRHFGMIQIDYGFQAVQTLGIVHRVGLGLSLF